MDYRDEIYFDSKPENETAFSKLEYSDRLTRLRYKMAENNVTMLYLMAPESMNWISGYQAEWYQAQSPQQWPASSAIAVHVDFDYYILFDSEREAVLGRIFTLSDHTRYFPRHALRGSADFIAKELKAYGWLNGKVGMEFWSYRPNRMISHALEQAFNAAGAQVVDATWILRELRWIKSSAEMRCLKEAAKIANIGLQAARDTIAAGVTELEVYGEIVRAMSLVGGENPGITMPVLSGTKTNALHGLATRRKICHGELVLVDLSGVFNRYHINMARTFSVGEPDKEIRDLTDRIAHSMTLLRSILKPGLSVQELNETVMSYFIQEGLWDRRGWIGGYEMGLAFPPDWVGNFVFDPLSTINTDRLFEPGTAVNYENQFFMPNHVGQYFTVDSFLFESDRVQMCSEQPFEVIVVD